MSSSLFRAYGELCASYPWEVIFATVTMTSCLFTIEGQQRDLDSPKRAFLFKNCRECHNAEYNAANVIIMTIVRCVAILYSYYQLRNLKKLECKYILIISGLFTVFSSFIFSSVAINFMEIEITDLKDAIFFFLLLIDLSKTSILAQFALSSTNQADIKNNIAKGMSILGPNITLDTVVETLLLSVGTLSGVYSLEMLSYFACLSVLVNYVVFMTFYPACLYLILELSNFCQKERIQFSDIIKEEKINPVVQRVKIIMSIGLAVVHLHIRWTSVDLEVKNETQNYSNHTDVVFSDYLLKWLTISCDHIVILILVIALTVKFIFFEDSSEIQRLQFSEEYPVMDNLEKEIIDYLDKEVQTGTEIENESIRDLDTLKNILKETNSLENLSNKEILILLKQKLVASHQLETLVKDPIRGVGIRRKLNQEIVPSISDIPFENYDYTKVVGTCCENVIGYVPLPVGIVGPILIDGTNYHVPMATTEGCLVASTNRGCRAVSKNGITSRIVSDGMTRGPVVRFPSLDRASNALRWIENCENYIDIKTEFDSTSRFARLTKIQVKIAGRYLFIRFVATTGDAMGMNMLSKATEYALKHIQKQFNDMEILSLSGNFCADKKPAAINWIEGRGKGVVCEAIIPSEIIRLTLKTSVQNLIDVNISKNLVGSAVSGSIGGFNAHASNIVTSIFIATGQDPAQNVTSSNCLTLMEPYGEDGEDLLISCTMPSLEVGTVGGGTILPGQAACLDMLGVRGSHNESPGANANKLARIVCGTVLAGELSLMAALSAGELVKSHLKYNRTK